VVGFAGPVVQASRVELTDYRFNPARITVATGTKVTFSNAGSEAHNAASSDGGGFDTGLLAQGESATVTFNRPGTYSFACTPHPSMIGQVIVTGPALDSAPATVVEPPVAKAGQAQKPPADHAH
jgi:plastocyanin